MSYSGAERRVYKVLITKNTEYHMQGARCIAVRDTHSGQWRGEHVALNSELVGFIGATDEGNYSVQMGGEPCVGARLCFSTDLLTSPLLGVRRPTENTVTRYRVA